MKLQTYHKHDLFSYQLPANWIRDDSEAETDLFWADEAHTGFFRVTSLLTEGDLASGESGRDILLKQLSEDGVPIIRNDGVAWVYFVDENDGNLDEDDACRMHYWTAGAFIEPNCIVLALFSFAVPIEKSAEPSIINQLKFLQKLPETLVFNLSSSAVGKRECGEQERRPLNAKDKKALEQCRRYVFVQSAENLLGNKNSIKGKLALIAAQLDECQSASDNYLFESLGVIFGDALQQKFNLEWIVVDDEYGREVGLNHPENVLIIFPCAMILKRVENGEVIDINRLFDGICQKIIDLFGDVYEIK